MLGFVKDVQAFSLVLFLKDKLRNRFDGEHLGLVVDMHNQSVYILTSFCYEDCFKWWLKLCKFLQISSIVP